MSKSKRKTGLAAKKGKRGVPSFTVAMGRKPKRASGARPEKRQPQERAKLGKNRERTPEGLCALKNALRANFGVAGFAKLAMRPAATEYGVTFKDVVNYGKDIKLFDDDEKRATAIDAMQWKEQGRPELVARRLFTKDERDVIAQNVRDSQAAGFPLDKANLGAHMQRTADELGLVDPTTDEPYVCCESFIEDFVKQYPDLKNYKSSAQDVKRAKAATTESRDHLFDLLDAIARRASEENPELNLGWTCWADVPDELKHNVDEMVRRRVCARAPYPPFVSIFVHATHFINAAFVATQSGIRCKRGSQSRARINSWQEVSILTSF